MALDKYWLEELIKKIKAIENQWIQDTFKRYRECGQLLLQSGYTKGKWNNEVKSTFMEETGYSDTTVRRMIILGTLSEEQFLHDMDNFKSLYQWAKQTESRLTPSERQAMEQRYSNAGTVTDATVTSGTSLTESKQYHCKNCPICPLAKNCKEAKLE